MSAHVGLHLLPGIRVVPDLLAIRADGQDALQPVDVGQRQLQLGDPRRQLALQLRHPDSDPTRARSSVESKGFVT